MYQSTRKKKSLLLAKDGRNNSNTSKKERRAQNIPQTLQIVSCHDNQFFDLLCCHITPHAKKNTLGICMLLV